MKIITVKRTIEDSYFREAKEDISSFIVENNEKVFYSRQLEIRFEDKYFHWITNRAINQLIAEKKIKTETVKLHTGNELKLIWNKKFRYYKREAKKVIDLVGEFSDPNIGASLGTHCELLILEGFAKNEFILKGRNIKEYESVEWKETDHNMDFIFYKDTFAYGIEIKNKLGYMDKDEYEIKMKLCKHIGVCPVFVVRMMPKTWINDIINKGGFVLVLKYQLYPQYHKDLALRVRKELELPVDSPKALKDETMHRFMKWHEKKVKSI